MKKGFLFLLLQFLIFSVYAQDQQAGHDTDHPHSNEIGLNVTAFLQNILGFSNEDFKNDSPYLLTYKRHFNKTALRFGIGGAFSTSKEKESGTSGTLQVDDYQADMRGGFEFQHMLSKSWTIYVGIDAIVEFSSLKTIAAQDFDKVTTDNSMTGFGGGPVFGVQWNINSRLNLSTDASLYFVSREASRKVSSVNFPEFNSKTSETTTELKFAVPFSIFLKFRI